MTESRGRFKALLLATALLSGAALVSAQSTKLQDAEWFEAQALDLKSMGQLREAIPLIEKALAIRERVLGPEHADTGSSLNELGLLYLETGAYSQAEPLFKRAVAIAEKALGPEHPSTAASLNNLAELYGYMGLYARAEPLYVRALAIRQKVLSPDNRSTAISLNNLGLLYSALGAYERAEPLLLRALEIMVRSGDDLETARAMGNVGQLYSETAEYELAESLLTRALALAEKALGPDALDTAATLNKLAFLYTTMGSYARAEPLFSRSLRIFEKVLGLEHPAVATNLENLAQLYAMTAVYQRPEPLFERALVIKEKTLGANHPDTARTRFDLALLDWREGRWVQANSRLTRAVLDRESSAVGIFALGDESRKRAYAQTLTSETYAVVTFALSARKRVSTAEPFAMEVVLQRKGRVLDVMADTLATIRKSLGTADEQLLERWRDTLTEYESLLLQGPKAMPAGQYRQLLAEVEAHASWLEGELSQRSAVLRRSIEPVTLARVKQALPKDAVLVEWFRYEPFNPKAMTDWPWYTPHYVAFILKPAGAPVAVDVGEVATIEKTIQDLLAALHDPRSTLVPELARELDTMLLQPLRPYLENTEHILLSPDGELNLLPFGVLMDERGRYLMDVAELTYLTSGRDLLRLNETLSRQAPVIFANPDFGTVDASPGFGQREAETDYRALLKKLLPFQALRGTATEAAAVQELLHLDARQVLTERNATVTALKALRGPRILHLASHGFFLPDVKVDRVSAPRRLLGDDRSSISAENPLLRSGLALANANRLGSGDDAGILTALEASGLDLAGTELAVLSACETGVGQVQIGEGVYGLRRALALAGVQTQVTSLWRVDDLATKDLMVDYYARLSQGAGRSAALRAAQTTIRKNPERRHPHYWAGFVVIGDPRPLTR